MTAPIDRDRHAQVIDRLHTMTGDMPSTEGGGGKGGHSDRTGGLAFRDRIDPEDDKRGQYADVATAALKRIDRTMSLIVARAQRGEPVTRDIDRLDALLSAWEPLNTWSVQNLEANTAGRGDDGCVDCAHVPDSLGRPLFNPRHNRALRCQQCLRYIRRVQSREGHQDADSCPRVLILWRERNPGKDLRDHILDRLLSGAAQP